MSIQALRERAGREQISTVREVKAALAEVAELEARAEAAEKALAQLETERKVFVAIHRNLADEQHAIDLARIEKAEAEAARWRAALEEIQKHNRLKHDLDDYLFNVAEWGLGRQPDRPDPAEYGLIADEQPAAK